MKIRKCANGHFFDIEMYARCPVCGAVDPESAEAGKKKKNLFDKLFSKSQEISLKSSAEETKGTDTSGGPMAPEDDAVTLTAALDEVATRTVEPEKTQDEGPKTESLYAVEAGKMNSVEEVGEEDSSHSSIKEEEAPFDPWDEETAPVVGWLVCVKGKHIGKSFMLTEGSNSIGRSRMNQIVLSKDNRVSREKHAVIAYEPVRKGFYLTPGEESGLTYLNDQFVGETTQLKKGDVIECGESQLMFIPLCDDSFQWESYLEKND